MLKTRLALIVLAALATSAQASERGQPSDIFTPAAKFESNSQYLGVTIDGKEMPFLWELTDKSPDFEDHSSENYKPGSELCLVSTQGRGCHIVKANQVAVFEVTFEGKAHIIQIKT